LRGECLYTLNDLLVPIIHRRIREELCRHRYRYEVVQLWKV
jgi:hypothetical protein